MKQERVIAISPGHGGFGFAVMEGPEILIDWGLRISRKATFSKSLDKLFALLKHYTPDVVLLEAVRKTTKQKLSRTQQLRIHMKNFATHVGLRTKVTTKKQLQNSFSQKTMIARAVAVTVVLPQLKRSLPRERRAGGAEDERHKIFRAVQLALIYYSSSAQSKHSSTN